MSALGQKRTYAVQQSMSALPPIATAKADFRKRSCPLNPESGHTLGGYCSRSVPIQFHGNCYIFIEHYSAHRKGKRMTDMNTTRTLDQRDERGRFLTGNIGGGRPKGSRNRLGEKFIEDACEEWKKSGPAALATMAKTDPGGFVRVIAGILPTKLDVTIEQELFAAATTFAEAFRIARRHIGAEDQLKAIEHDYTETSRD
jgi:hypothetical protein